VREPLRTRALVPVLLFVAAVGAVVSSLGAPLVPSIAEEEGVSLPAAQWTLTIALLVAAVATPALGRLGDGPRRKNVLVGALLLVTAGGVLAALPTGYVPLLVGRGLQGLGLGLTPLVVAVAREHVPAPRTAPVVGMLVVTTVTGVGFGYPLAGLVTDTLGLHAAFWFGAGLSAAAALLAGIVVPSARNATPQRFDVVGAVLLGGGLGSLLVVVSEAPDWGMTSWRVLGLVAAALVLLGLWVWQSLRTAVPLVDIRLLRHRPVLTAAVTGVLTGVGMYLLLSLVTRFVQTPGSADYGFDASVVVAGLALLPFSLASAAGSRIAAAIARRVSIRAVLPLGASVVLAGSLVFALAHDRLWQVFLAMGVAGLGVGGIFAALPGLILPAVPPSETGSAMGFNQVLRMAGFSLGSALSATVLELHTPPGASLPSEAGYTVAALLGVAIFAVTVVLAVALRGRRPGSGVSAGLALPAETGAVPTGPPLAR
jgi:MFS family permease